MKVIITEINCTNTMKHAINSLNQKFTSATSFSFRGLGKLAAKKEVTQCRACSCILAGERGGLAMYGKPEPKSHIARDAKQ